jgi:taurine dioxygenase
LTAGRLQIAGEEAVSMTSMVAGAPTYRHITVDALTPAIGAEVGGVALRGDLSPEVFDEIQDAFLRHKVLVFRDQHDMTVEDQMGFGRLFGSLDRHPGVVRSSDEFPHSEVIVLESTGRGQGDYWHTDATYMAKPPTLSILCARIVPPVGGDTMFANMELAYDDLEPAFKERLAGLKTWNTIKNLVNQPRKPNSFEAPAQSSSSGGNDRIDKAAEKYPPVEHPLVRTHPETGRKSVFFSPATAVRVLGVDEEESKQIMQRLLHLADVPEYQCRLRWTPNTVAMWDNRCAQHYAVADYFPARRRMERVTVIGTDRPS